jgi:hypothetical protein
MSRLAAGFVSLAIALTLVAPAAALAGPSPSELLTEQVASQSMIGALLGTTSNSAEKITVITFDKVTKSGANKAVINVTAHTAGGTDVGGKLVLKRYRGVWYFYSITRGTAEGGLSKVVVPAGLTTSAMNTAIKEQRGHRWMLDGIVKGGYKKMTVLSRHTSWNTQRVNVKLSGGSRKSTTGRVYAFQKRASNGKKFWFISTLK